MPVIDTPVLNLVKATRRYSKKLVIHADDHGRIRILFENLQRAKIIAASREEKLTITHIREARGED